MMKWRNISIFHTFCNFLYVDSNILISRLIGVVKNLYFYTRDCKRDFSKKMWEMAQIQKWLSNSKLALSNTPIYMYIFRTGKKQKKWREGVKFKNDYKIRNLRCYSYLHDRDIDFLKRNEGRAQIGKSYKNPVLKISSFHLRTIH